jgi:UDP-glucose 4-epimerase
MGGGPQNTVSIWQELRPRLECLAGRPLDVRLSDWRPGDQPIYVSDTSRAQRDFGWTPRVGIDEGLERLWAWAGVLAGTSRTNGHVAKLEQREPDLLRASVVQAGPVT